ncbi:hypothetical protein YUYDRAFT_07382 [Streptomyces sp. ScaeMP-e48]|nr:hypothetical protein YUYDRAFT_07382 [Streptomyces sp. ScaeMP-e48]
MLDHLNTALAALGALAALAQLALDVHRARKSDRKDDQER